MTERERRYRSTERGQAWVLRSAAQQTRAGRHAEAQARYQRRKADERDALLREELTARGTDVAR